MSFVPPPASSTTHAQREVELTLLRFLEKYRPEVCDLWGTHSDIHLHADSNEKEEEMCTIDNEEGIVHSLNRESHEKYLKSRLVKLPEYAQRLYNAQPWMVYWTLQAAEMLGITEKLYEQISQDALGEFILSCLQEQPVEDEQKGCWGSEEGGKHGKGSMPQQCGNVYDFLRRCDADHTCAIGFSGGNYGQIPHLATSYAGVCSLCILGCPEYLQALPRSAIKRWLLSLRCADGSFRMHIGGEADIRASYCVAVITTLLQLQDVDASSGDILREQEAQFVASCQTHEGGFACGRFASEAHGAYTQCGLAALILMKRPELCNYTALRGWLAARQLRFEGGFNGRTNKLVDSCYAHWVGASHVLLRVGESLAKITTCGETKRSLTSREMLLLDHAQLVDISNLHPESFEAWSQHEEEKQERASRVEAYLSATPLAASWSSSGVPNVLDDDAGDFYFNQRRLQLYILACCQNREEGGLMDKPNYPNDFYHTCYSLSGMSSAQNLQGMQVNRDGRDLSGNSFYAAALSRGYIPGRRDSYGIVLPSDERSGVSSELHLSKNCLRPTNPIFNINQSKVLFALRTWGAKTFMC
ncbi:protein farnesyltransferase beta subunit [Trypanosoma brucei equiperdum]|uniref:Protein farnesyltransferase subunit beta n=1 Tax=Trypanosoma brucei equiperdum TaxID=630700 RepID=A0A3L6L4A0_9TRYP|nr:protein farnesyltransferase beta subunit [Trypanosoma brucei equiperdum]